MKTTASGGAEPRGGVLEIGSLNRTISLLGASSLAKYESLRPLAGRDPHVHTERSRSAADEPAFETNFSRQALERSDSLTTKPAENSAGLSEKEQAEVRELVRRDREVRDHEQAHKAAAGRFAIGGPSFEYQRGPDGRRYAIGGEVQIDVSPVAGDPAATIRKMRQVASAARAPANPSSADQRVAATAAKQESAARVELREEQRKISANETSEQAGDSSALLDASSRALGRTSEPIFESPRASARPTGYAIRDTDRRGASLDLTV